MRQTTLDQAIADLKAIGAYMPKADKTRWIKALRSGKYKQGKMWLYRTVKDREHDPSAHPDTYCCIGVDCALQGAKLERWSRNRRNRANPGGKYKRPGLMVRGPAYTSRTAYLMLADLNDCGAIFTQIADVINAGVKGV